MDEWLISLTDNLAQREEQIDLQLSEVNEILDKNQEKIRGLSEPLKQLTNNASRPTHAIQRWSYTLSRADEILQLGDSDKPSDLFLGDST